MPASPFSSFPSAVSSSRRRRRCRGFSRPCGSARVSISGFVGWGPDGLGLPLGGLRGRQRVCGSRVWSADLLRFGRKLHVVVLVGAVWVGIGSGSVVASAGRELGVVVSISCGIAALI